MQRLGQTCQGALRNRQGLATSFHYHILRRCEDSLGEARLAVRQNCTYQLPRYKPR
jgi:hypothetical protein